MITFFQSPKPPSTKERWFWGTVTNIVGIRDEGVGVVWVAWLEARKPFTLIIVFVFILIIFWTLLPFLLFLFFHLQMLQG
jgi:hypothetical protein